MTIPSDDDITLSRVLSETKRILRANRKHFFILSLLFLLPFALSLVIYIIIFPIGPQSNSTFAATPTFSFLQIVYLIVSSVFSISASGTIIYSTFHGYYNRPLELIPTLKALLSSFIPLCSTLIVMQLIFTSIGILTGILGGIMNYYLESFNMAIILVTLMVCVCTTYLQMNWFLSSVIVVVESKWGYEPLRRSAYLMKGMKRIALKMFVLFGVMTYVLWYTYYWSSWTTDTDGIRQWILRVVMLTCGMTVLMEYGLAASVVMYIYSKKMHGEVEMEIQPEEYVSLLIDDDGSKSVAAAV